MPFVAKDVRPKLVSGLELSFYASKQHSLPFDGVARGNGRQQQGDARGGRKHKCRRKQAVGE